MAPHRLYNIGNNRSEELTQMIALSRRRAAARSRRALRADAARRRARAYADIGAAGASWASTRARRSKSAFPRFVDWYEDHQRRRLNSAKPPCKSAHP